MRRSVRSAVALMATVAVVAAGCSSGSSGWRGADALRGSRGASGAKGPSGASEEKGSRRAPTEKATGSSATGLDLEVDPDQSTAGARFRVQPGSEEVTVTGVKAKARLSLVNRDGKRLVVLDADKFGQAHFAYLPAKLAEFSTGAKAKIPATDGYVVEAGSGYTIRNESTKPVQVSKRFSVLGRHDSPKAAFYERNAAKFGPKGSQQTSFGYVTMRDGVQLSVNIRLPGPADKGPYPTVVEYSGYGPSNPDATEPGSMIAGLLGFATVGVNLRGTGCSGGVFDVFNTAQQVDGYDMIEGIARQPWVKNHRVGMVGLSYAGITQLYTAATQPPSLAAITSLSVLKDPWLQQWPGGIYNGGFTKQWLAERDRQSSASGASWVGKRVKGGDRTCEANQKLREQNIDFESFGRSLVHRPKAVDDRDLSRLVSNIKVPVYLTGAWQDEQTGPQFGDMLDNFAQAPVKRFTMFNGRHPDGYTPLVLTRWYEFLRFYVDKKIPRLSEGIRTAAPPLLKQNFGDVDGLEFEPDRFARFRDDQYDEALAAYEKEADVRVLFDVGAATSKPGSPVAAFTKTYASWPPKGTDARSFYFDADGALADRKPTKAGADRFANDPAAASKTFFGKSGYQLLAPTWDFDWTSYAKGNGLAYLSEPFGKSVVLGGPGYADLQLEVPDGDADVQVSVNLVRPDGTEWHVTTGMLRVSDRKLDKKRSQGLEVERTYAAADSHKMPAGRMEQVKVAIPSFAQAVRAGDRLRVTVSSPGRDLGTWSFDDIGKAGAERIVGRGATHASRIVLGVLPDISTVPDLAAPCPSLRGQACRPYTEVPNTPAS